MGSGYGACEDRGVEIKGVYKRLVHIPHRSSKYCTQYRSEI